MTGAIIIEIIDVPQTLELVSRKIQKELSC